MRRYALDTESAVQAFKLKGELVRTAFPRLNVAIETILERLFALENWYFQPVRCPV